MTIKQKIKENWKYVVPVLGLSEYEFGGREKDENKRVNPNIMELKGYGQFFYGMAGLLVLSAYFGGVINTKSLNPAKAFSSAIESVKPSKIEINSIEQTPKDLVSLIGLTADSF